MSATDRARVLVVDDELGPRESLRMILKPRYEIATADSGEAALKTLTTFRPDLVFMDIKMPQMDGIELLRRIKRTDPSIEVVMITAYASLETVKNALTHGAFEYLIKPFSRQDLEETARRALARRQTELGTRSQLATLVDEMRSLAAKTRGSREAARREQAEPVAAGHPALDPARDLARHPRPARPRPAHHRRSPTQLRDALGYDEVDVHLGAAPPEGVSGEPSIVCPIRDDAATLGYLVVANRAGARPIDPRERELLEMLSEYLAVAIRNSRLYGEIADTKRSLEQLISSAGDAIISVDAERPHPGAGTPPPSASSARCPGPAIGRPITDLLPREPLPERRAPRCPASIRCAPSR